MTTEELSSSMPPRPEGHALATQIGAARGQETARPDVRNTAAGLAGLTFLTIATRSRTGARWAYAGLGSALVGGAAIDMARSTRRSGPTSLRIVEGMQINAAPESVYGLWRDLERWPTFMRHIESIEREGPDRWRWKARLPGLGPIEWTAELTKDDPGRALEWRTLPGGQVDHRGSVTFEPLPAGRGTGVRVELGYEPPAGAVGRVLASLLQPATERIIRGDVKRLKSLLEAGEVPINPTDESKGRSDDSRAHDGNGGENR